DWDIEISFANHGGEAIDLIRQGKGDILFLDLNMPVMDGYETLAVINSEDLPSIVVVVSGDIQPDARKRVMQLGAADFIRKPIGTEELATILQRLGILGPETERAPVKAPLTPRFLEKSGKTSELDAYQEIANVAMGQAADLLAR